MPRTKLVDKSGAPLAEMGDERARIWNDRLNSANELYDKWSKKYNTEQLEEYYYGKQWDNSSNAHNEYNPYVNNKFFIAIDVKLPSLLFQNPQFVVKPKPTKSEYDEEGSALRAKVRQDMLNFFFSSNITDWGMELDLALLNAQFSYGLIEVLHTSDWIENPEADKPLTKSDVEMGISRDEDVIIKQPKKIPVKERLVLKYIPAKRFRVSTLSHPNLNKCAWWAYWEYFDVRDLENNENYDTSEWNLVTSRSDEFNDGVALQDELDEQVQKGDLVKVWKIFDNRAKTIEYLPENHDNVIRTRKMRRNTIIPLKFRHRLDTFYPLPVTYNWKSPQDELNDIREAARVHRRRYVRKYVIATNSFEEEELNKLQFGGDGAMAETKLSDARAAISPMPNADLGAQHFEGIQTSTNDFDNVAGISAQQRGESTGASATETSIVDKRSTIRESRDRIIVANWLCEIAKVMLLEIKERTTLDFWVKVLIDEANDDDQLAEISEQWTLITKEEITGDEDFDVDVSVTSLSPVAQQADKSDYIEFLSVLQQFPIVSMSPHLIRETANKLGYRNENVIRVFQKLAQAAMFEKLAGAENIIEQAMQGGGGTGAGQLGQKTIAQAQPNTQEQITNQLQNPSTRVQ